MITVKVKTGMLAGAILTAAAISMPAQAATTYDTNFQVFDIGSGVAVFDITGTVTYDGPATLTAAPQDLSLTDANNFLDYDWNINSIAGNLGNFTGANSFWNSFTNPPLNVGGFPVPFQISETLLTLKPLTNGQNVQLFTNDWANGISIEDSTNGLSYVLGKADPIPTPALLPGLLGFGATIVRRKKQQSEAAA